jgi:hypothetical protein
MFNVGNLFFLLKPLVEFVMGICQILNLIFVGLSLIEFDLYVCD